MIDLDNGGMIDLVYENPYDIRETVVENTTLLSYDEVIAIFEKMMPVIYAYMGDDEITYNTTFTISKFRLGLMCIAEQNKKGNGLLVPVWSVYANTDVEDEPGQGGYHGGVKDSPIMTINAIDGSLISQELGY